MTLVLSMPNNTGMQLNEFKDLLRKVLNTPGQIEALAAGGLTPTGGIIMWSGSTVPIGWYLCDGTNGTPNLSSKFILAGGLGSIGTTAAEQALVIAAHSDHAVTQPSNHIVTQPSQHNANTTGSNGATTSISEGGGAANAVNTTTHTHSTPALTHAGTAVDAHSGTAVDAHSAHSVSTPYYPPYYTLAFIQKS